MEGISNIAPGRDALKLKTTRDFLVILYGKDAPGTLTLWTRRDQQTRWVSALTLGRAARIAQDLAVDDDVYFGVGLRRQRFGNGRGRAEDVIALPALYLDLDVAHPAHKRRDLPPDRDAARRLLDEFPLAPSILIDSGHGFQVYWLFTELWRLDAPDEHWTAQLLLRRLQATVQELARRRGWHIDSTFDLARVLRLPGTVNRKARPVPVEVVLCAPERRYQPGDFEPHVLAPEQLVTAAQAKRAVSLPKELPSVDLASLDISERLRAVIRTGDDPSDPQRYATRSEAVGAAVTALVVADYNNATIAGILLDPNYGISAKPREQGVAWVAQEIARIRAKVEALGQEPVRGAPAQAAAKPFPLRVLPAPVARFVRETAEAMPVAVDLVAVPAIAVAGAAIGSSRAIALKDGWQERPSVYAGVMAGTGEKKSPTLRRVLQPLYRQQLILDERYEAALAEYQQAHTRYKLDQKAWEAAQRKRGLGDTSTPPPGSPPHPRGASSTPRTRRSRPSLNFCATVPAGSS